MKYSITVAVAKAGCLDQIWPVKSRLSIKFKNKHLFAAKDGQFSPEWDVQMHWLFQA